MTKRKTVASKRKPGAKPKPAATKKAQQKKIMITTLAVGATGILGYFGWQYLKKRKEVGKQSDIDALIQNLDKPIVLQKEPPIVRSRSSVKTTSNNSSTTTVTTDEFPLQKGSKGENVKRLQEALIAKYGKAVLPKYGADGDFGSELAAALKKLGLPSIITESTLNVIAQGTAPNPAAVGKELYEAALKKDYAKAIATLKKLRGVDDYTAANNVFKQYRIGGVRQTIVNGLLSIFSSDTQKQALRFQFLRMGLQFDGDEWSLSGFDGLPIVTLIPTSVWVNATGSVKVPARMVLGNEVTRRLDYTLFENGGKHFLVQTKTVKHL